MFTYDYQQERSFNSNDKSEKISSTIEAKFRFNDEVAPKDRAAVNDRLINCSSYLKSYENIHRNKITSKYYESIDPIHTQTPKRKNRNLSSIFINKNFFKLGINILMVSSENIEPKEFMDFERFNHFILTGEYSK